VFHRTWWISSVGGGRSDSRCRHSLPVNHEALTADGRVRAKSDAQLIRTCEYRIRNVRTAKLAQLRRRPDVYQLENTNK